MIVHIRFSMVICPANIWVFLFYITLRRFRFYSTFPLHLRRFCLRFPTGSAFVLQPAHKTAAEKNMTAAMYALPVFLIFIYQCHDAEVKSLQIDLAP